MKKAGVTRSPHVWELPNMNSACYQVKAQPAVIFFDAAGTLIHLTRSAGWHYADLAQRQGMAVDASAMDHAFRAAWKAQPPRETASGPRHDDDRGWWKSLAISVLHASAARLPPHFDEDLWFDQVYARFAEPGVWALYEDVLPCLTYWKGRARLAVLSNFDQRLRTVLTQLGALSLFEQCLLSSEAGADKPEAAFFHHACEIMNVAPVEALHVGDDPERDWSGATAAGLNAFPLQRPQNSLDELRA